MRDQIIPRLLPLDASLANGKTSGDFELNRDSSRTSKLTPAAVLVPLVEHPSGLTVLLTRRTEHLHDHAGQVSFPGGRVESQDESPISTALRETQEEVGIAPDSVELAGFLDPYETATGFMITPVVGFIPPQSTLKPDAFEVAEIFEVPMSFILEPENQQRRQHNVCGTDRWFYVFEYQHHYIWGATAGMLMNLSGRLG